MDNDYTYYLEVKHAPQPGQTVTVRQPLLDAVPITPLQQAQALGAAYYAGGATSVVMIREHIASQRTTINP